jgi:hypothetical protein
MQVDDLANTTHDPLLAALRQRLRKTDDAPRQGDIGVRCVFSRESVRMPDEAACAADVEASLNCHGYGSCVMVTASFGLAAASDVVQQLLVRTLNKSAAAVPLHNPPPPLDFSSGSLAQLVEQRTLNPLVEGSNPSGPTKIFRRNKHLQQRRVERECAAGRR